MKKLILTLFIAVTFLSCSKSDSPSGLPMSDTPTAKVAYDNSNFGIYKGVFVGSTGIILIDINNSNSISATLVIDGKNYKYTTTTSVIEGEAINALKFQNGNSYFDFSVYANGDYPSVSNFNIENHPNANIQIIKEQSEHLVKCYQGTYTGSTSGTLNLIIREDELSGLAKQEGIDNSIELSGTVTDNIIDGLFEEGTFDGTITGNNITGHWKGTDSSHGGDWTAIRKL